jgi:hypothetical protein
VDDAIASKILQQRLVIVVVDDAAELLAIPRGGDPSRNVRRAAETTLDVVDHHVRHRRFRGNPVDAALLLIRHEIGDDPDCSTRTAVEHPVVPEVPVGWRRVGYPRPPA